MPAGNADALNVPSAFAVRVRVRPVSAFDIVIFGFGITPPDSSVTVPDMVPIGACAKPITGIVMRHSQSVQDRGKFDMFLPLQARCDPQSPALLQ